MIPREESLANILASSLAEALWPTRCCACDAPGTLLCDACKSKLNYVDYWRACPSCGGPLGIVQCTECNSHSLRSIKEARYPFDSCTSSVLLDDTSRRMVLAFKDGGETRLGAEIASIISECIPRSWKSGTAGGLRARKSDEARGLALPQRSGRQALSPDPRETGLPQAVFFVPASKRAYRRRGFDHAEILARHLAKAIGLPCWTPLLRPEARDQRSLGRKERALNAGGSFRSAPLRGEQAWSMPEGRLRAIPKSVVLVDDVFTSGSTLSAASIELKALGVTRVHAVTFARTWAKDA